MDPGKEVESPDFYSRHLDSRMPLAVMDQHVDHGMLSRNTLGKQMVLEAE